MMKNNPGIIILILLLVLVFPFAVSAKEDQPVYKLGKPDVKEKMGNEEIFDSLLYQGWELLATNPDQVRNIARQASLYLDNEDTSRKIKLLNLFGITDFINSSYEDAVNKYLEGLTLALDIEDNIRIASFYNNIGIVNLHTGNYMEALEHFMEALDYYEKAGKTKLNINTLNNLGMLYSAIDNYEKAKLYMDQAYEGFLALNDTIGMAAVNNSRGIMFLKMEKPDSALLFFENSINLALGNNNKFGLSGSYIEIAKVFFFIKDYPKALEYFEESQKISRQINYQEKLCEAKIGIARTLLEMDNLEKGLSFAEDAMIIAELLSNNKLKKDIHEFYSDTYERQRNYELSLFHNRKYTELKDKLNDQSKLHKMYNIEIQELSQAKEIQKLEIERQELLISRKNTILLSVTFAFLLIMAGLYLLYRNYKYRELASHQKEVLDLKEKKARAAVEAEIRERKRIGQELHDGLGQMLSVARLNISVIQQKKILSEERKVELLESAINSVDKAFFELRNISHNLAPAMLSQKGFTGALKEMAEQVNKSQLLKMTLEIYGLNSPLDNLVENTLFRAIQELLNNAIKHSEATSFFLQIVKNENEITLMVEDNGKGFEMEKSHNLQYGGLHNIKSRVENLNGNVFIDTMINRGTIINISIPLNKKDQLQNQEVEVF